MPEMFVWIALGILVLIVLPLAVAVMAIVALIRSRRVVELLRRLEGIEARLERLEASARPGAAGVERPAEAASPEHAGELVLAEAAEEQIERLKAAEPAAPWSVRPEPIGWELLIGRRALGWVAVMLLVFAAAFFIRFAIENQWIGPLGQVALAQAAGLALVLAGWRYHQRSWTVFSQMLTAGGVVVLYLATYAAFGFYQLLPRELAAAFLAIIIVETAILAWQYNALAIALTAVLGGLSTPLLMSSPRDQYVELFIYLAALNLGVVLLMLGRAWPAIGSVGMLGTQGLFWSWYVGNYHPEKLPWALGFQAAIYLLYLGHSVGIRLISRRVTWEDLARLVLGAVFWFAAFYVLLRDDFEPWMGTAAIGMAAVYAAIARMMLIQSPRQTGQVFTALAISVGFIALAFPIQAEAAWVALGWAAQAAALWWFGQRVANLPLRAIAAALAAASVLRLLGHDLPSGVREPFVPVFNSFALPALGVAVCILVGVLSTRRFLRARSSLERQLAGLAAAVGVLLLWLVLSLDCYGYFAAQAHLPDAPRAHWLWLGQMALSVLWAVFATAVLVVGFRARQAWLRWLAIGLYGVTVLKVLLIDMRQLDEIYRIVAFLVLAILMGLAAWSYQRMNLNGEPGKGGNRA